MRIFGPIVYVFIGQTVLYKPGGSRHFYNINIFDLNILLLTLYILGLLEVACAHRHVRHLRAHESTLSAFHFSDFDHYEKFTKSWSWHL